MPSNGIKVFRLSAHRVTAPRGKLRRKAYEKNSREKNAQDLEACRRSVIERSLFEHIPIRVSINYLIFLKNRAYLLIIVGRCIIFNVERHIKL